ncbi:hypothetical protein [Parvibaculum sp.]|uniref:hypothetical protein n=1 Tax=Parvibaculum sp. TaxID=2024848 RepID=UPI002CA7B9A4|nr:hypothetical protein [Parvibaculum sp.]HUD52574.1 hypothetical protein [Parvibaculum sp.]
MKSRLFLAAALPLLVAGCASTETVIATQAVTISCTYVSSTSIEPAPGGLEVEVPTTFTVTKTATNAADAAAAIKKETGGKPCTQVSMNTNGAAAAH